MEKKFDCDICQKAFLNKYRLKEHKETAHSEPGAMPFICDQCGKGFKAHRNLKNHTRRQHVQKHIIDEFCEFCGKGYAFKERLKEHLMSTHKLSRAEARASAKIKSHSLFRVLPTGDRVEIERPIKSKTCQFCHRTYVRLEQLFTHLMALHGKSEAEAKEITGLQSSRNLLPTARAGTRKGSAAVSTPAIRNSGYEFQQHNPSHSVTEEITRFFRSN